MHPASVTADLVSARDVVRRVCGDALRALFGPQHGFAGEKQDNMIESGHGVDPELGIPVHSLYSETRSPSPEMLEDIDVLLVDLQDVGTRVYTFEWTTALALEACAAAGKEVVVLDRPNPLGGEALEGNLIREGYTSFVGLYPVPMRHGLTLGELAALVNLRMAGGDGGAVERGDGVAVRCPGRCALRVVPMEGWRRRMLFPDTGLPWVLPSPNMPTFETAVVYPGQVLLEGTNVSEGRGTTRPLELFGAPDIDARAVIKEMASLAPQWLGGCRLRDCWFEPTFHKHVGKLCNGIQIHTEGPDYDHQAFRPWRIQALAFKAIRRLYPDYQLWRNFPYEYERGKLAIDVINGGSLLREWVDDASATPQDLDALAMQDEQAWLSDRQELLRY